MMSSFTTRQFELFTCELFKGLGYNEFLMLDGPDGGKDVILNGKRNSFYKYIITTQLPKIKY